MAMTQLVNATGSVTLQREAVPGKHGSCRQNESDQMCLHVSEMCDLDKHVGLRLDCGSTDRQAEVLLTSGLNAKMTISHVSQDFERDHYQYPATTALNVNRHGSLRLSFRP